MARKRLRNASNVPHIAAEGRRRRPTEQMRAPLQFLPDPLALVAVDRDAPQRAQRRRPVGPEERLDSLP
jgi:hypothetical protein